MLPQEEFDAMRDELTSFDEKREELIITSRKLQNLAKKAMYNTHRDELDKAKIGFDEALPLAQKFLSLIIENRKYKIGAVTAALQEWAECVAYYVYVKENRLITQKELELETEDYLLALSDLTGELTRRAVLKTINKEFETVKSIRLFIDDLLGVFLSFNFRNGELRKKTDQVRWNLQKVEELLVRQN